MSKVQIILSKLPNSLHKKAQFVLDAMLTSKNLVDWDKDLRLIANKRPVIGSNVANLVAHVLYPSHSSIKEPLRFDTFVKMLKQIGLEHEYVINKKARKALLANTTTNKSKQNLDYEMLDDDDDDNDEEDDDDDDDDEEDDDTDDNEDDDDVADDDADDVDDDDEDDDDDVADDDSDDDDDPEEDDDDEDDDDPEEDEDEEDD